MEQTEVPKWRYTLDNYRANEKIALSMTIPMLEKAIKLIWNDPVFTGMPVDSPDGSVIFVPKEAAPLLRAMGVKFVEQRILDVPNEKHRTLRSRECLA